MLSRCNYRIMLSYGEQLPNGTWDGLVGELAAGRADIAVSILGSSYERNQVVDFPIIPIYREGAGRSSSLLFGRFGH